MIDDLLPEALIRVSPDGDIEHVNRVAREFFAESADLREGRPLRELVAVESQTVDSWLTERRRVAQMVPGRMQFLGPRGLFSMAVEAGRIPESDGSVLIRFRPEGAPYHRLVELTRRLEKRRKAVAERDQLLLALENETRELSEQVRRDGLTGLFNRRHFDQVLEREWNRALRTDRPLALVMLDVDHFKEVNDRFGHTVGDDVLRLIARALMELHRRASDFVARYGGEEFAILLAETPLPQTLRAVDATVRTLRMLRIPAEDEEVGVTVSAGIASMAPSGANPRALVEAADRALYAAKNAGRDQWVLYEGEGSVVV